MKSVKIFYFHFPTPCNQIQVLDKYRITVIMQYCNTAAEIHQVCNIFSIKAQFKVITIKNKMHSYIYEGKITDPVQLSLP